MSRLHPLLWSIVFSLFFVLVSSCETIGDNSDQFSFALSSTSLSLPQGGTISVTATVARSKYTGPITLVAEGLPTGVTASFDPATIAATTTTGTVHLTASSSAPVGSSEITIRGKGTDVEGPAVTAQLTVTTQVLTPINYYVCGGVPIWFAYQNEGSTTWTPVTGTGVSPTVFTWSSTPRTKYVRVFQFTGSVTEYDTFVNFATLTDLQALPSTCVDNTLSKSVTGSATGLSGSQLGSVVMGPVGASLSPSTTSYSLSLPNRALDLVGLRYTIPTGTSNRLPDQVIISRNLNPTTGSALPTLAFGGAGSITLTPSTLTMTGTTSGETQTVSNVFFSANQSGTTLMSTAGITSSTTNLYEVPAASTVAGDLHRLLVLANATSAQHYVNLYYRTGGNRTVALPPLMNSPVTTVVSSSPYPQYRGQLATQTDYNGMVLFEFWQPTVARFVRLFGSASYFGGLPTSWDLTLPNFTGTSGFILDWMPKTGQSTQVDVYTYDNTSIFFGASPTDGLQIKRAWRGSSINTAPASAFQVTAPPSDPPTETSMGRAAARTRSPMR